MWREKLKKCTEDTESARKKCRLLRKKHICLTETAPGGKLKGRLFCLKGAKQAAKTARCFAKGGPAMSQHSAANPRTHFEQKLASEDIYAGKIFTVTRDTVRLENGGEALRELVHHNGGAGVVAVDGEGRIALVRQYRYAQRRELLEIPAGKVEKGEPPRETALRELAEEAGCTADTLLDFGSVIPTGAYCTEVIWIFLATGLHKTNQNLDEDEFLTVLWVPFEEAVAMVLNGEITDAKSISGILRAKAYFEERNFFAF